MAEDSDLHQSDELKTESKGLWVKGPVQLLICDPFSSVVT